MWYSDNIKRNIKIASLEEEAQKYDNVRDFIRGLEAEGKMQYHGSSNDFEEFSYDYLGANGTNEGKGFYFTNKRDIAKGYKLGPYGKLFEAYVDVRKPLSPDRLTISRRDLIKFLKALDPDGSGYLSNYGDVSYEGYDTILNEAVNNLLQYDDNDVDLISGIVNGLGGNPERIYPILKETLGYDGIIIHKPNWGEDQIITVAFSNDQIYTRYKLAKYWEKLRESK